MARPVQLDRTEVDAWLAARPTWARDGDRAIARTFTTPDFAAALALAVEIGLLAERRDHHPDLHLGWGKLRAVWTTHDAGGVTRLDLELAVATDALAARAGGRATG